MSVYQASEDQFTQSVSIESPYGNIDEQVGPVRGLATSLYN